MRGRRLASLKTMRDEGLIDAAEFAELKLTHMRLHMQTAERMAAVGVQGASGMASAQAAAVEQGHIVPVGFASSRAHAYAGLSFNQNSFAAAPFASPAAPASLQLADEGRRAGPSTRPPGAACA